MPILTIRLSEAEKARLTRDAAAEGVTAGAYVRQLLRESPLRTGRELLREMESRLGDASLRIQVREMTRPCLLDSSFVIDLLNETAAGRPGAAHAWLRSHPRAQLFVSTVTYAEVLEGAEDDVAVRRHLHRYRWQGLHRAEADLVARLQRRATRRLGENDAWQVAVTLRMGGVLVGHDKAFVRLGDLYEDHRSNSSRQSL